MCRMCINCLWMLGRFQPTNGEACDSGCSTRRIVPGSWSNPGVVTRTLGRLGFGRARVGGAFKLVADALAGTAYGHRADIETSYSALTEHMQDVGALWEKDTLAVRLRCLVEGEAKLDIVSRR